MPSECTTEGTTAPPDWARVQDEVHCPLCNYNLRGLTVPRCPECGYRFAWPEVLDPQQRLHPYLFEHHPERNFRSFWRTALAGFRPGMFWSSLHPGQPSSLRRLLIYFLIGQCLYLCVVAGLLTGAAMVESRRLNAARTRNIASYTLTFNRLTAQQRASFGLPATLQEFLDSFVEPPANPLGCLMKRATQGSFRWITGGVIIPLLWPWLTFASLQVFWISMRRSKVRPIHALRCSLYSFDGALWMALLMGVFQVAYFLGAGSLPADIWLEEKLLIAWGLVLAVGIWRLRLAYDRYMRLDHPLATVMASQIIVGLIAFQLMVVAFLARFS